MILRTRTTHYTYQRTLLDRTYLVYAVWVWRDDGAVLPAAGEGGFGAAVPLSSV